MKISRRSQKDYEFFLNTDLDTIGSCVGGGQTSVRDDKGHEWKIDPTGHSALECWFWFDTHGKSLNCREPEQLGKALRSKASWNLQIREWAVDIADGMLLQQPELVDYCHDLPEWIFVATMKQAAKLSLEGGWLCCASQGFAPRFARLEYVKGHWWPPYMDSFDPMI